MHIVNVQTMVKLIFCNTLEKVICHIGLLKYNQFDIYCSSGSGFCYSFISNSKLHKGHSDESLECRYNFILATVIKSRSIYRYIFITCIGCCIVSWQIYYVMLLLIWSLLDITRYKLSS